MRSWSTTRSRIRPTCHLSLGYDHRLVDGADADRFMSFIKERLEKFDEGMDVRRLGTVAYDKALALQQQLVEDRKAGLIADQLLLLEHPAVVTLGVKTRNDLSHLRTSPEALAAAGVGLFESGRGGDVTYHGPGQLVGYPIIDLNPHRRDVHRYVRDLEEVLI